MLELTEEQFDALGQHYLDSMQSRMDEFREGYESDTDFANEEEQSDVLREVGRCMEELRALNEEVEIV